MSLAIDLPVLLISAALASLSLVLMVATMRLFPAGYRFVPFAFAAIGFLAGMVMQDLFLVLWSTASHRDLFQIQVRRRVMKIERRSESVRTLVHGGSQ
jgi:hypothetical protein